MELSFPELILIFAIALIALGPKDMIKTAQQLGRWMGKLRTQFGNIQVMLNEEILQDEKKKLEELKNQLSSTVTLSTAALSKGALSVENLPKKEEEPKAAPVTEAPHG